MSLRADANTLESARLVAAIKLMNDQVIAGEGVDILHYFETAMPGDPVERDPQLTEYARAVLVSIRELDG